MVEERKDGSPEGRDPSSRGSPGNVFNRPVNVIDLYNERGFQVEETPELPHHALLDARLLMHYY
jgi:hypothetical protein